jgi:hypothetical protein
MKPTPKPPPHLRPETAAWFAQVLKDYELEPHHLRLLTRAAEAFDRAAQAREILAAEGLTFLDRNDNPRPRPEVAIERDSRIAFARLLRELALDVATPETPRPPTFAGKGK